MKRSVLTGITVVCGCIMAAVFTNAQEAGGAEQATDFINFHDIDKARQMSRGEGVTVAVLDWMFNIQSDSSGKYIDPVSLVPGEPIGEHDPWHGEWMAELIHEIAPEAKIIPIRARPNSQPGDTALTERPYETYLIQGIRYAADNGAAAVSSSMGPLKASKALNEAVAYAANKGTVFIDVHPEYSRIEEGRFVFADSADLNPLIIHAGIVPVNAHPVTQDSRRDVCTWPYQINPVFRDGWGYSNGPPIVAGVIALMKSVNPGLTVPEIKRILVRTARMEHGFRVLNADRAVRAAKQGKR